MASEPEIPCMPDGCVVNRALAEASLEGGRLYGVAEWKPMANGGMHLVTVPADSVAHQMGMRSGDRLVAINGRPLGQGHSPIAKYVPLRVPETLTLGVVRAGASLTWKVTLR